LAAAIAAALMLGVEPGAQAANAPVVVTLSLDHYAKLTHLEAGDSIGVAPAVVHVHIGDTIVFVNGDQQAHHTATGLSGATRFGEPRWTDAVLKPFGTIGAQPWSSGELAPGASSAPMVASSPGAFLYGCFFHYSAGMRGEIIVEP
jgi:plastocyanin